jgi:predicted dehydrogenase
LTIREGRAVVGAARTYKRVFQVGTQRRSSAVHRIGCALVRTGRLGTIKGVIGSNYPSPWESKLPGEPAPDGLNWDTWCGQTEPVPYHHDIYMQRAAPGWISLRPYSGGEMTGTGAHGLDLVQWALGTDDAGPVEVWAEGGKLEPVVYSAPENRSRGNTLCSRGRRVTFRFAGGITLRLEDGSDRVFTGEKGKIIIGFSAVRSDPPELAARALKDVETRRSATKEHLGNWFDAIRSREQPAADVEIGHRSAVLCHLGNIARWTGRRLKWDPEKEVFPGDAEATAYLERSMRKPFHLPQL